MPPAPARNDPCPCGSGRKYKHCCLAAREAARAAARRLQMTCARVTDRLLRFAAGAWGDALLQHAWDDFWNWDDVPDDLVATPEFDAMFIPWFVFAFVPDPHSEELDPGWPVRPIALAWLESATDVSDEERRWIKAACRSPLSAFVVGAVDVGTGLDVRDVLTGARFRLIDSSASRSLLAADLMFTRVLTLEGVSIPFGTAPLVIPPRWHPSIIDWRVRLFPRRLMTRAALEDFDIEIRDLYFDIRAHLLDPAPPRLTNTDGDDLAFTTLTFRLTASVEDALARLAPLATIDDDDHTTVTTGDDGAITSATIPWLRRGNRRHKDWTNTELGIVRLEPGQIIAEANSARRAERVKREIARRLKSGAVLIDTAVVSVDDLLRSGRAVPPASAERSARQDEALRIVEAELSRRHWERWVDLRVPALGNKTPRQAARTALGRERLEALLAGFERDAHEADRAHLDAIRQELALGRPGPPPARS